MTARACAVLGAMLAALAASPAPAEDARVQLVTDTAEADAVLAILGRRAAAEPIPEADWARLFAADPYRRLKRREAEMKRDFSDEEFRQFVLSDDLLSRREALARTLEDWKRADLEAAARRVLAYLPAQARIRARVFPVIKPRTNSFVFEAQKDPAIFLYLDPALGAAKFENTVAHELHHIGLASLTGPMYAALSALPPRARAAAEWMGAFGEGMAMLAAAGGPDIHPHAVSEAKDRERWDRDLAAFPRDLRALDAFFLDVVDGRLEGDAVKEKAFSFFGEQGPWYTVGWQMAALVERRFGRAKLIECMLDPRRLLAAYNRAVAGRDRARWPRWSPRLLKAVRATAVRPA